MIAAVTYSGDLESPLQLTAAILLVIRNFCKNIKK
jgi:hypothetical protein